MNKSLLGLAAALALNFVGVGHVAAQDDEDSLGYVDRGRPLSARDRVNERKVASGMMDWVIGDSLSGLLPKPSVTPPPSSETASPEARRIEAAAQQLKDDQRGKLVGDIIVAFVGAAFFGRPGQARSPAERRQYQQSLYQRTVDRDGFIIPQLARELHSLSGVHLLCIYVTGTKSKRVPSLLIHPILDAEFKLLKANPHELVVSWARVARNKIERVSDLPLPGRWDFRPIVVSMDLPVKVVYPPALNEDLQGAPEDLPSCLRLIRFGSSAGKASGGGATAMQYGGPATEGRRRETPVLPEAPSRTPGRLTNR